MLLCPLDVTLLILLLSNATAPTAIYTLSLHDALPIFDPRTHRVERPAVLGGSLFAQPEDGDRKSTRLNSSHEWISYAVFCLKKKTLNLPVNSFMKLTIVLYMPYALITEALSPRYRRVS